MSTTHYRILDVGAARLAVASPIGGFHADIDRVYPYHEPTADDQFADIRVSILPGTPLRPRGQQANFWSESVRVFEPYPLRSALPLFEWGSNYLLAQRLNAYLLLHSGVVARDDRALILPAAPGSGKTTLTCALSLSGWRFLSDEFGIVDMDSGELLPIVRPAPLKNRSIEVIGQRTGAVLGPRYPKTRKGDVAHFVPDQASFEARHRRAFARLVIFPTFQAGSALDCRQVSMAHAAMRLGLNSFNYRALGVAGFDAVVALTRKVRAFELTYSNLDEAIAFIDTLFSETS